MIDWAKMNTTRDEVETMSKIVNRVLALGVFKAEKIHLMMDLEACHAVCPLRLADMLTAANADLIHDILGIYHHLDHETGELQDGFLPRFAA